jgi:uncharacterized protein involved in outer membrane biogenesis
MKRILAVGGVILVLAVAGILWFASTQLDSMVAQLIETHGSQATGTAVRVGSVSIDVTGGRGTIRGLRVANPKGYSGGDAFQLGEITLGIDLGSIKSSPIVIDELTVSAPKASYEVDAKGRSNFDAIKANLDRGSSSAPAEASDSPSPRIAIKRFEFQEGSVSADFRAVDSQREKLEAELPPVRLQNVGGSKGGTPAELGKTLAGAFTRSVAKTVAANEAGRATEKAVGDKLGGDAGKAAGGLMKKIMD